MSRPAPPGHPFQEIVLVVLVAVMAVIANLPSHPDWVLGIERDVLLAALGIVVFLAMFLYLRFFFFLLACLLAVGANLPDQWAAALAIDRGPLLLTLAAMVVLSLGNRFLHLLPSGLERSAKNPEAIELVLRAIERGNPDHVARILVMDFDLNLPGEAGLTPLMRAAQRGDDTIVDLLLRHGADPAFGGPSGRPADLARERGFTSLADRLDAIANGRPGATLTSAPTANAEPIGAPPEPPPADSTSKAAAYQPNHLIPYFLEDVAPVFNLILAGSREGHFSNLYLQPRYMAGLGIQLFTLLAGRIRLPDRRWYPATVRILRHRGEFAGFVILRHEAFGKDSTEIYMAAILPELRGQGLGEWMLRTIVAQRPIGRRIFAHCLPRSYAMKAILEKLGFREQPMPVRRAVPNAVQQFVYA